ncbi:ABC transporter substrate-binding protein [Enhydrobacter sp.]|jgi:branched-chain amino acid transport system substrate-binding protein|uniref:ABC transporter substrate-binding protein n=1 Tax=Enhydrobacter sp. TaxID=1894999 RepID=UPI00261C551E|nr:ABC transporter substrate-binding protein [Enhydrobacter sp.]WIM10117.1 MAG: Branched-chain amino acid ABC transporter, binding protein [Enhydrobacter sp.]
MGSLKLGRRQFAIAASAGAAGLAFPALAQGEPIKVGVIVPLSGAAGPNGQAVLHAVTVAADMVNAAGGVMGRKLAVVAKDDESTPAVGVTRANELAAEKVAVVIEGWNSPVTLAMQPVLARADILDITAVSKADQILSGKANPYAIRINSPNGQDGAVIADILANKLSAKRIGFMTENDAYGNGAQQVIEAELKATGKPWENVVVEKFPFKQTDFRVSLTSVKQAKPDAVVAINAAESSGMPALIQQYRQAGIEGVLVGAVGTILPTVFKIAGEAMTGVVSADIYFPDLPPFNAIKANLEFIAAYRKDHNETPDKGAALGATALQVWASAANATKSLDRKTVAGAIRGKTIKGTILGDLSFEADGQAKQRYTVFKVTDGKTAKIEVLK